MLVAEESDSASGVKRLVAIAVFSMHARELGLERIRPADNCVREYGEDCLKCEAGGSGALHRSALNTM